MADPDDDETDGGQEKVQIVTAQQAGADDAADPKAVRRKARKVTNALEDTARFWANLMSTEDGRKEVWTLLAHAHPFETRFGIANGFPQAEASWLEAGRQGAGFDQYLYLLSLVPELTTAMVMENEPRVSAALKAAKEKPRRPPRSPSQSPR